MSWKITLLYFFSSNNTYFAQKEPIKVKIFETWVIRLKFVKFFTAILKQLSQVLCKFCIFLQFHERYLLYTFLAQAIRTSLKWSPLKWKFLRLWSARVKFCQIPYVNFETTSRFLSKFCFPLWFHERLFLCTFLAQTIYTLLKRSPLKWKCLRLSSARVKFCQIPYANFETMSRFLSRFCIPLQCHER